MLVLLELGFHVVFISGYVKVFMDKVYYGSRFLSNGFMVLDIVNIFVNDNASIYVVGNSITSNDNNSVIWHARLGYIGQD